MASFSALTLVTLAVLVATAVGQRGPRRRGDTEVGGSRRSFAPDLTVAECDRKVMDIYFILDSSTSIYYREYDLELQFVREVVNRMDISPSTTRVGVVTYSDEVESPEVALSQSYNKDFVLSNINNRTLPYRTGLTNTDQAISFVRGNDQWRQDITKVIVVVTDGGSRNPDMTALEAEQAKEDGFYLFVIGVGQYTDEREWKAVASDPDESFIYNITSFSFLDSLKESLPPRACNLPPIVSDDVCSIQQEVDLFFVAGPGGTEDALELIRNLKAGMSDGGDLLRLNYMLDACASATDKPLTDDIDEFCDSLSVPDISTQDTYSNLLSRMREAAQTAKGVRTAKQVGVLFLDSESLQLGRDAIINEARNAQVFDKMELIPVDLGVRGFARYITAMTANRQNVVRFTRDPLDVQMAIQEQLADRTCEAANRGYDPFGVDPVK